MSTATLDQVSVRHRPVGVAALPPLRLTGRGRLVVFAVALAVVVVAVFWVFGGSSAATDQPTTTRTVIVGTGQTLWGLAADAAHDGRTGAMVTTLERMNHLDSGMVYAGQRLVVPVG